MASPSNHISSGNLNRVHSFIGEKCSSKSVRVKNIISITIRVPARDIALIFKIEPTVDIGNLFESIASKLKLDSRYHYLTDTEEGKPMSTSITAKDLLQYNIFVLYVSVKDDAPFVYKIPLYSVDKIRKLSKKITSKNSGDIDIVGRSLLHLAAEHSEHLLKHLIKKKYCDVNLRDSFGYTPLMYAAKSGFISRINILVTAGASINCANKSGETPLHQCAKNNSISSTQCADIIEYFAEYGLTVYTRDVAGNTPAHTATAYSNGTAIRYFIEYQYFHLITANNSGDTCLHIAVKAADLSMVQILLELKAPKYVVNEAGLFPVDVARLKKLEEIERLLSSDLETRLILRTWDAIKENNLELVKELNVRYRDRVASEETKAMDSSLRATGKMITSGGGGNRHYTSNESLFKNFPYHKIVNIAVMWAAARFHLEIVDYLMDQAPINFTFKNSDGSFMLYILCNNNPRTDSELYLQILKKCLASGARLNDRNIENNCCLHIAALTGNKAAVKFLLDNGAFPNSINDIGLSELHYAILDIPNVDIIAELAKAGADYTYKLKTGLTVVDFAQKYGSPDSYSILAAQCEKSKLVDLMQPNAVKLTLLGGENLLPKDDNGLSDPFCSIYHVFGDLQQSVESTIQYETLNPFWNEEYIFIVKSGNIYYRDIVIDVYDWDPVKEGELQINDFIGSTTLILNPRDEASEVVLELRDQEGLAGTIHIKVEFLQYSPQKTQEILDKSYEPYNPLDRVNKMLKAYETQSVGTAKAIAGFEPKYPVLIIPGLASSSLEAWETPKSSWLKERVWVDPFKIGKTAISMKISNTFSKKKKSKSRKSKRNTESTTGIINNDSEELNEDQRIWLRHMLLAPDGFSDPPGIKLRPVSGISAVDFLSYHPLAKKPSYVFGQLIPELAKVGYTPRNLDAAPYDWRLPPEKLEERDAYFTQLKTKIQLMREINNERVVLMAHSMGNRTVQYFLNWVKAQENCGQEWIDKNVHAFLALGPPFLGATKTVRAVVSGDCLGLEVFLTMEEGRTMSRGSASLPWLFPIQEDLFPDTVAHMLDTSDKRATQSPGPNIIETHYNDYDTRKIVEMTSPLSSQYVETFYDNNPFYGATDPENGIIHPPITQPPPVENLWVLYGINLDTEVSYYFKPHKTIENRYILDRDADKFSNQKIAGINPRGLRINGGVGYETKNTFQPSARANKGGDGTVPYCSLHYASFWEELINTEPHKFPLKNIRHIEVEGADHREMLSNPAVFDHIINLVCSKPIG